MTLSGYTGCPPWQVSIATARDLGLACAMKPIARGLETPTDKNLAREPSRRVFDGHGEFCLYAGLLRALDTI
jgi:hypothetical protein